MITKIVYYYKMAKNEITVDIISKQQTIEAEHIINCENYISTSYADSINIYELDDDLNINWISGISTNIQFLDFDFNHKYKDILLTVPESENIKIYKILSKDPKVICILKQQNSNDFVYAKFNPNFENIVMSYNKKNIDFWDLNKYVGINSITTNKIITDLKWNISGDYIGYIENLKSLKVIHRDLNQKIEFDIKDLKYYEFKNNNELITFHRNLYARIYDIRMYNNPRLEVKNIEFSQKIYDKINDYIYMNKYKFQIYNSHDFTKIFEKDIKFINKPILLDSYCIQKNEIANLLDKDINSDKINIIKIKKNNNQARHSDVSQNKIINNSNEFINNIVYMISSYSSLSESDLILKKDDIIFRNKNYIYIPEIKQELENIQSVLLPDRKKYVDNEIKKKISFKNIFEQYIYYLRLLIRDNTNKILVKNYLNFLEKNETELSNMTNNLEKFKDEVEYYKIIFTKEEYKKYFGLIKEKSEKENLIEFMNKFINIKNKDEFINMGQNLKHIAEYPYFNQSIIDDNEELMYFKNKLIIYSALFKTNDDEYIYNNNYPSLKKIFELILKYNYLDNNNITKDLHKFNLLISLIISPENDENNKYILNLLSSNKSNDKDIQEIQNYWSKNSSQIKSKIGSINDCKEKLCKNNVFDYLDGIIKIISTKEDLYNYEFLLNEKINEINLGKIKSFLKIIFKGDMFKSIFRLLYNDDDLNIILQNSFIDDYIDNHLFLVPYKSDKYCGITDRFSCNSYIFYGNEITNNNTTVNKDMIETLKTSRFIVITFHEFNHYIFSYILHANNYQNLTFDSPRKKELILNEGGYLMELILLGELINNISFEQALYILDERNYLKKPKQFQEEYVNISSNDKLFIKGSIYSNINYITSQSNFKELRNVFIKAKIKKDNETHRIRRNNCVLGRNLSISYSD